MTGLEALALHRHTGEMCQVQRSLYARLVGALTQRLSRIGSSRLCPCCGNTSGRFLAHGLHPRPGARCPHCGSLERHRLLWLYLSARYAGLEGLTILHAAPEPIISRNLRALAKSDYTSVDITPGRAEVVADLSQPTALPEAAFDLIVCSHVLEHVEDDRGAMTELHRLLALNGELVVLVPVRGEVTAEDPAVVDPSERERLFGQHDHVRWYGKDIVNRLENAGFTVAAVRPTDLVDEREISRYSLSADESIFVCSKD